MHRKLEWIPHETPIKAKACLNRLWNLKTVNLKAVVIGLTENDASWYICLRNDVDPFLEGAFYASFCCVALVKKQENF